MISVWCVRADYGKYAPHFVEGGYAAIDYDISSSLAKAGTREDLAASYRKAHPEVKSNLVVGQQAGQLARFLLEMKAADYVITPDADTDWLHYGVLAPDPSYFFASTEDGCPFRHRRQVAWSTKRLRRGDFSVPFQNTMRSSLTVFTVSQRDEFFNAIGEGGLASAPKTEQYDAYRVVLEQVLELDAKEFEILVGYLLTALGFEGSEVVGKTGDGGVDATGTLNVANLAKIKVFVQAKRYKIGSKISGPKVRELRQAIPSNGQGAFITTSDFQAAAHDVASELGFPRIGLVNGRQLVDLLIEHWDDIPQEFRERLGLRPGLVRV